MNQPDLSAAPLRRADSEMENLAEKIALTAREMSAEIDRDRRLPDELVARLGEAGLLRATMPREVQAAELASDRRCGVPKRWRAAMLQRDGACRSRSPARCWSPIYRRPVATKCSVPGEVSPRVCGHREVRRSRSTAVLWCPGAGRSAAGSTTRT